VKLVAGSYIETATPIYCTSRCHKAERYAVSNTGSGSM